MLKKILISLLIVFNLVTLIYLITPTPKFADLPNSVKSNEPGDTIQIPNVSAYYTNLSRVDVMNFYKQQYNGPLRIVINHPPEKAKEVIKDTMQSYYLEELEFPFKESLYVNGFEWENDVFTKPNQRIQNKLIYQNKEYKAKITIRTFPVLPIKRIISFLAVESVIAIGFFVYKSVLKNND